MTGSGPSHTQHRPGRAFGWLLLAAAGLLALGLLLPIVRVERLWLFERETSLLGLAYGLLGHGEIFLGTVVTVFSVIFPAGKLAVLAWLMWRAPHGAAAHRALGWVERLGRWSMLDVLVVALVVFSIKASGWATAASRPGLYCFAGAVVLTMVAAARMRRRLASAERPEEAAEG